MDRLEAKIKAVNAANKVAVDLSKTLLEIFTPLVGEQVLKTTAPVLLKKIEKLVPEFINGYKLDGCTVNIYKDVNEYHLCWVVKTCCNYEGIAEYHQEYVIVGDIKKCVLTSVHRLKESVPEFTADFVREQFKQIESLKDQLREVEFTIYPFR